MGYGELVNDELRGYRTSSARRGGGSGLLVVASLIVVLLAVVLAVLHEEEEPAPPLPTPTSASAPEDIATTTPVATVLVEETSEWIVVDVPTATSTPWPTAPPTQSPTTRPMPSPTPLPSECVIFRWTARQVFRPSAQVMVEIDITNRCNRDFGSLNLWFEITGWRNGEWIQSVRGHPFESISRGRGGIVTIGLPGSIDWYDEITVEVVD